MSDFNDLLEASDQVSDEIKNQLNNEVTDGFYIHSEGEHKALFSGLRLHYRNDDKKKCTADTPGAKLTGASARFIIVKDPSKQLLKEDLLIDNEEDLGRLTYNQYISLKDEDQWKHVRTFGDFTINDLPEANIVLDGGKRVALNNLPLFVGVPVVFQIVAGKKEGSRFAQDFTLQDHTTLTKELLVKRKGIIEALEAQLTARSEKMAEEREAKKARSEGNAPVKEVGSDKEVEDALKGMI